MAEKLGLKIKLARTEKNLTQEALAEKLNTSHPVIANWESGKYIPKQESIRKLAAALGKPLSYFLDEPGDEVSLRPPVDPTNTASLPLYAQIPAGAPEYMIHESSVGHISVPKASAPGATIAVVVGSDSMEPTLYKGDQVALKPFKGMVPIPGKMYVVKTEKGVCIKKLHEYGPGKYELVPDNKKYPVYRPKHLVILWEVVSLVGRML